MRHALATALVLAAAPVHPIGPPAASAAPAAQPVIAVVDPARGPVAITAALSGVTVVSTQPALGTFVATVDLAQRARLAGDARIRAVVGDRALVPVLDESTHQIGADVAWSDGITGAGQTVAIVDTGVAAAHPMLAGRVADEACFTATAVDGSGSCPNGRPSQTGAGAAAPCLGSGCGHGTHVASIAAGGSFAGRRGVAPDALVLAVQVFTPTDVGPRTDLAQVLQAFEWVYQQHDRYAIAAINLSVASSTTEPTPCRDPAIEQAALRLSSIGIAVVAAAGNNGSPTALAYPACAPGVVSVGSVDATNTASGFSNRADTLSLFAPGEVITAASPGGGLQTISGTSQAAPHVAGAFALVRQQQPDASAPSVAALLDRTAATARDPARATPAAAGALRVDRAIDPAYRNPAPLLGRPSPPFGAIESIVDGPGRVTARGWVLDPASVTDATIVARVDGAPVVTAAANEVRHDVAERFPGYGDRHGFELAVTLPVGADHELCVDARGDRVLQTVTLGCAIVAVPTGSPVGSLDVAYAALGQVVVQGWAFDPDVAAAIDVHVYIDGGLRSSERADHDRADVGSTYPGYGPAHGFDTALAVGPGDHTVCVYGIDRLAGANALIGCRIVRSASGVAFGALDTVRAGPLAVSVAGWALDPDRAGAVAVHLYVDGRLWSGTVADRPRSDVEESYRGYGAGHGFETALALDEGRHTVCAYAIGDEFEPNPWLGCRDVIVGDRSPFGAVDVVGGTEPSEVRGWAIDPDTASPVDVHVYVDGVLVAGAPADRRRIDVGSAYPDYGAVHGFRVAVPAAGGSVCVYGINVGSGSNSLLGCRVR